MLLQIGNPLYLSWCLEGLAAIALVTDGPEHAARLCDERAALLARLDARLPPMDPAGFQSVLDAVEVDAKQRTSK